MRALLLAKEVQFRNPAQVHQRRRLRDPLLHQIGHVHAASLEERALLRAGGDGARNVGRLDPGEGVHAAPPSAASTTAGVIGVWRTRLPVAWKTAFATAAAVGTVAGSPMPLTSVFVRPR